MKRLFVIFVALLSLVSIFGCSKSNSIVFPQKDEIEFLEERPVYSDDDLRSKTQFVQLENRAKEDNYDIFKEFTLYYANNIKNKVNGKYFLLNPGDGLTGWIPHYLYKAFYLFADDIVNDKYINSLILEVIYLNDTSFKKDKSDSEIPDGGATWNIRLRIIFAPVNVDTKSANYELKFGNNAFDTSETYVNIYCGDICFATCFYEAKFDLSYNWFLTYFEKNLSIEN